MAPETGTAPMGEAAPPVLTRRLGEGSAAGSLRLPLTAGERARFRGLRRTACGREVLLQLPRGEALRPGERLAGSGEGPEEFVEVIVEAAAEPLLVVRAEQPLELLRAAYHLGNRHVALEVRPGELRLLEDPVLADLLGRRGLRVERRQGPFLPEAGAYAGGHHGEPDPSHGHDHDHDHDHDHP